jgi:hypothetical protein
MKPRPLSASVSSEQLNKIAKNLKREAALKRENVRKIFNLLNFSLSLQI